MRIKLYTTTHNRQTKPKANYMGQLKTNIRTRKKQQPHSLCILDSIFYEKVCLFWWKLWKGRAKPNEISDEWAGCMACTVHDAVWVWAFALLYDSCESMPFVVTPYAYTHTYQNSSFTTWENQRQLHTVTKYHTVWIGLDSIYIKYFITFFYSNTLYSFRYDFTRKMNWSMWQNTQLLQCWSSLVCLRVLVYKIVLFMCK